MNADRLLSHFERISDAPDAVDRLRRFMLDLAVRGKLVEQEWGESAEPSEAPAAVEPFPLPSNWSCVALGGVLHMINGRAFKPSEWSSKGLPIVRIQNLNNESALFNCCDPKGVDERHTIDSGTFLISWSGTPGTSFGAFIWQRGKAALNQHIFKCLPTGTEYLDRFLQLAINGRLDEMIAKAHGGVGLQHITKGKLEALALPLPPLAEQHRIVAKVDELMKLCDRLEASQQERESRRDRLVMASLNRLSQPTDPDEFRKDAGFQLSNLTRLSTKPEHIKELRKAILNLAVRGRLTSQKARAGDLPPSWSWSSVEEVGEVKLGRQRSPKDHHGPHMVPYLRVANVYDGYLNLADVKAMNFTPEEQTVFRLRPGDVLLNEGQSRELVGRPAIYQGEIEGCCFQNTLLRFRCGPSVTSNYALLVFRSYLHCGRFQQAATQTTNMAHLSASRLKAIEFPLPPLAEQKRIVAKVDELMLICDQLENHLESQQMGRRQLLEALLHEALQGVG